MNRKHKFLVINAFVLKLIALLSILSDHVAFAFVNFNSRFYVPMRVFGQLAFVLFAFFIVQGVIHSRNRHKYLLRLFYLYITLQVFSLIAYFATGSSFPNVFMTLLTGAALLTYVHERKWKNVYLLVPFVITLTTTIIFLITHNEVLYLFTGDYDIYGLAVIIAFYAAYLLTNIYLKNRSLEYFDNEKALLTANNYQITFNAFSCISLFVVHGIWYIFGVFQLTQTDSFMQHWALLVLLLLPFYNGKLGHNSKAWRVVYYLFFPVHLVILALITQLI